MDFFASQEEARKNSKKLVFYFALAVLAVALAVGGLVSGALAAGSGQPGQPGRWDPGVFALVGGGTIAAILLGSLFKSMALSSGGPAVARSLGGRKLDPNTTDADERKLLNVVEEMSIASGVPVPEVYLMADEHGINAFAAGRTTSDAVIGVTRGCMKLLDRDELQGVIAHEFSHILNGDMRLNLRLMGLLFGILMLTIFGRIVLRSVFYSSHGRSRNSKDSGGVLAIAAFGIALIVIGYLGVLFAKLIKAAVSRQREFLADASAVQFTRNPDGIGGALKKIGGFASGSLVEDPHAEEASHMFFANGLKSAMAGAFATHPPLDRRIRAIDKTWDGKFPRVSLPDFSSSISSGAGAVQGAASGMAALAGAVAAGPVDSAPVAAAGARGASRATGSRDAAGDPVAAFLNASAVGTIGELDDRQVDHARQLYASLPEEWVAAAHNEAGAQALIFAMLLAQDDDLLAGELHMLESATDPSSYAMVLRLHAEMGDLHSSTKIALIDLAIPTLRRLSPDEYERFGALMKRLIESDRQVDLFEFMLQKIVRRHLDIYFSRTHPPRCVSRRWRRSPTTPRC